MTKNIAWIGSEAGYVLPYQAEMGFNVEANHQHYKYASEALEGLKKKKFDLVVLDYWLAPGEDYPINFKSGTAHTYEEIGLDLVGRIKKDTPNQKTPIVILTAEDLELPRKQTLLENFKKQGVSEILGTTTLPEDFYEIAKKYLK